MFTKAQEIASWYQSPGPSGIGFARYASTGEVTPELWDNIRETERDAANGVNETSMDDWAGDMAKLRELLAADGHTEPEEDPRYYWDEMIDFDETDGTVLAFPYGDDTARIIDEEYGGVIAYVHKLTAPALVRILNENPLP